VWCAACGFKTDTVEAWERVHVWTGTSNSVWTYPVLSNEPDWSGRSVDVRPPVNQGIPLDGVASLWDLERLPGEADDALRLRIVEKMKEVRQ